jgi:CspA family cold shock protein
MTEDHDVRRTSADLPSRTDAPPPDRRPQPVDEQNLPAADVGTVRWFSPVRGFGFIAPDTGGDDVFVHQAEIAGDGFRTLAADDRVRFEMHADDAGPLARGVRPA